MLDYRQKPLLRVLLPVTAQSVPAAAFGILFLCVGCTQARPAIVAFSAFFGGAMICAAAWLGRIALWNLRGKTTIILSKSEMVVHKRGLGRVRTRILLIKDIESVEVQRYVGRSGTPGLCNLIVFAGGERVCKLVSRQEEEPLVELAAGLEKWLQKERSADDVIGQGEDGLGTTGVDLRNRATSQKGGQRVPEGLVVTERGHTIKMSFVGHDKATRQAAALLGSAWAAMALMMAGGVLVLLHRGEERTLALVFGGVYLALVAPLFAAVTWILFWRLIAETTITVDRHDVRLLRRVAGWNWEKRLSLRRIQKVLLRGRYAQLFNKEIRMWHLYLACSDGKQRIMGWQSKDICDRVAKILSSRAHVGIDRW